jgi:hypothetical protein
VNVPALTHLPELWLVQSLTSFGQEKIPDKNEANWNGRASLRTGQKNQMHHGGLGETALPWLRPEKFGNPGDISEFLAKIIYSRRFPGDFAKNNYLLAISRRFRRK